MWASVHKPRVGSCSYYDRSLSLRLRPEALPMSQRILLIESDPPAAMTILGALNHSSDEQFEVEWVRRCSDALERLDGAAAILVDLHLPDSRGIDTFDRLYHAAPRTPILVMTDPHDEPTAKLA